MGLPQANRLKHRRDFKEIYQHGSRYARRHLVLITLPAISATTATSTKIGIVVSQKVSKKAVVRNRIKRRIRAALQSLIPDIAKGWRLVVIVRPRALECEYEHFLRELEQLLRQAEVLDGH